MERMKKTIEELRERKELLRQGGDPKVVEKIRSKGMLTARERLDKLLDHGSFTETDMFVTHHCFSFDMQKKEIPCDGQITGYGEVDKRAVFVYSQDFSAMRGTIGEWGAKKICKIMDLAANKGVPFIGINQSLGARLEEMGQGNLGSGVGFFEIFYRNSIYSGVIPQISLMMGDNAGGQVYGPGLTDFVIATKQSNMFIAGPVLVKSVISEDVTSEYLGGAEMHASVSGAVHVLAEDDEDCIRKAKELLSFLPSSYRESPPIVDTGDDPQRLCPELEGIYTQTLPFDMHKVIISIVDNGHFFEIHKDYAKNIIVGFSRFDGRSVGIIAANSLVNAGAITVNAAEKAARFVRFCDAFNIPVLYLCDNPAYMVGSVQERAGMIYRGATLIYATSEATVPKISIAVRRNFAGAWGSMGSWMVGTDICYAWSSADMSGLSPKSIADVIYRAEIESATDPEEKRKQKIEHCRQELGDIYNVASWQNVNDIIEPQETRIAVINALKMTEGKKQTLPAKKHGCMPL